MYGKGRLGRPGTRLLDDFARFFATPTTCATRRMSSEVEAIEGDDEMSESEWRGGDGGRR
jgi:hypothetical protein